MKNALLAAVVVSLFAAGCARQAARPSEAPAGAESKAGSGEASGEKPDCPATETECRLTVRVGPGCKVSVHPKEKRYLVERREKGVEMLWRIDGDASFDPKNGIRFTAPDFKTARERGYDGLSNPLGVFVASRTKAASDSEFRLFNRGTKGYYYYAINVIQKGKPCPEHDPGIANQ